MPDDAESRDLEGLAMNIVHQIGDALYEALPQDIAHEYFVTARQKTNDMAIDFVMQLIKQREAAVRIDELDRLIDINGNIFNKWTQKDIAHFFDTVGKRYRELESTLTNPKQQTGEK